MTHDPQPVSRILAEFLATTTYEDLPPKAIEDTRLAILDWFGSALGGALERPAVLVREAIASWGQGDEATVFPGARGSAPAAALANGVASHILELDDIHKGSTVHAAAPVIPAALAVAEREGASGRDLLLAVALGYEAALRVGEAVNPSHYRYWHPTGTAATFGAAAAAGSLLGLDAARMLDSLGSAGTQAAGLWEFNRTGEMSKHLHPGKAAFNGVLSADLARAGFTGAPTILEGERGFFAATSTGADPSRITDGLGTRWKVSENGYKLYSCCGHTHSAIDLALDLRTELGWAGREAADRVTDLEIALYGPGYEIVSQLDPRTPYQAKFSAAYVVSTALLEGKVGLGQFGEERFGPNGATDDTTARLLARTRVTPDPELTDRYPARWPARLTVVLDDGTRLVREADYPRGNPENPVPLAFLQAKARDLVAPGYGDAAADRMLALVAGLESIDSVPAAMARLELGA